MKLRSFSLIVALFFTFGAAGPFVGSVHAYAGFIADAVGPAQASQAETGVPASVTIAQAILESGWGDHHLGTANNYFGIKCQQAAGGGLSYGTIAKGCVLADTQEWDGTKYITVKAHFRSYASMTDSFRDHADFFLKNPRYAQALKHTEDPRQFAIEIHKAGYATSPTYAADLTALMDKYNLYQYDTAPQNTGSQDTSTVLLFDNSGSMDEFDATGVQKIVAARDAGTNLLEVIGAESRAGLGTSDSVAIASFSYEASLDLAMTTDVSAAEAALAALWSQSSTAMPKGLRLALDAFPQNPSDKSFIILLSDGMANVGLNDESDPVTVRNQVLDLSEEAGRRGICIFAIGFGDPSSATIDTELLQDIADNSGCGAYRPAANAWELASIYIDLRHSSTGITLLADSGVISQDQLLEIGDVQMPDNQASALFTLNWPGSQLDAILKDPNGALVDTNYSGATVTFTDTLASIIIQDPLPGTWNIAIRGVDVPEGTTTYKVLLSVRPDPVPPAPAPPTAAPSSGMFPLVIIVAVLSGVGVMVYAGILSSRRRSRGSVPGPVSSAGLAGQSGEYAGQHIAIRDGMVIGRSSSCELRLRDPAVSRRHAQLRMAGGRWYVQDMKSSSGIFLNGKRVQASALARGDRLRLGSTEFEFRA